MAIETKYLFALDTNVLSVILFKVSGVTHLTFSHVSHQVWNLFQTYALTRFCFVWFFFCHYSSSQPLVPMSNWQGLLVFCISSYRVCFPKLLYSSLGTGQCVPLALHTKAWSSTSSRQRGDGGRFGIRRGSIRILSRSREHFLCSHCVTKPTCSRLSCAKEVLLVWLILFQFLSMEILI